MTKNILFLFCTLVFVVSITFMVKTYVKKNATILKTLETFVDDKRHLYNTVNYVNNQKKVDMSKFAQGEESGTLSMFAHNKFSPHCCPSTYSSDRGCVCITDAQKKQLQTRGHNNVGMSEY
jgi:hypothetical protein